MNRTLLLIVICQCILFASTDEFNENELQSRKLMPKQSRFQELLDEVELGGTSDEFDDSDLAALSEAEVEDILNGVSDLDDERSKAGKFLLGAGLNFLKDKLYQWGFINKPNKPHKPSKPNKPHKPSKPNDDSDDSSDKSFDDSSSDESSNEFSDESTRESSDESSNESSRPATMGDMFCKPLHDSIERRWHACEVDVERGAAALMKAATKLEKILRKLRECEKSKHCDVKDVINVLLHAASRAKHCLRFF